jgi:hypothetical protein
MGHLSVRPLLLSCVAAALLAGAALDARAWGDEGHQVVGVIAYERLTPAAKKKVDALLAADSNALTAKDFVSRTTWADKWRDSDRNSTKVRYSATHNWHFVDTEISDGNMDKACNNHPPLAAGKKASEGDPKDCVVDKINQFEAELKSPATTQAERILALKFILHFVGDLHQPLHASDNHDRGGNEVPVLYGKKHSPDKLHAYWDTKLVKQLGKDAHAVGATLAKQITKVHATAWSSGSPTDWARESFELSKKIVYDFSGEKRIKDDHGGMDWYLDSKYDARALPVVREQLSKAGVRLAHLLNEALK